MSALATQTQLVTVTLVWREPNGQIIQFGGDAGSSDPPAPPPAAPVAVSSGSSGFSGASDPGAGGGSTAGSNVIDLFA